MKHPILKLSAGIAILTFGLISFAAEIANPTGDVSVPAGETLTVRGALAPQGSVTVPATGTLDLQPAATGAEHALPDDLREGLLLWMNGSTNVKTDDGGNVSEWRDVRDSGEAEATACAYPRAVFKADFYDYFDSVAPTVSTYLQRGFVDFGAFGSGSWMPLRDAQGELKSMVVRSFFAIVRPHPTDRVPVGQLLGHTEKNNVYSYCGASRIRWIYSESNASKGVLTNAETRLDGVVLSSDGATWPTDGGKVHLLTQIGPAKATGDVDNFGNWQGYHADDKGTGKSGGKYTNGNRQGGPCIGEILLFDRCVSDVERRRIEAYLVNKWFASPSLGSTDVAAEGKVSVAASERSALYDLSGKGEVTKTGAGTLAITRNGGTFEGTVKLDEGTLEVEQNGNLPPLAAVSGKSISVSAGTAMASTGGSDVFSAAGEGNVTIGAVEEGVRRIEASGVTLALRSHGTWTDAASLFAGFYSQANELENGGFEDPVLTKTADSKTPTGWIWSGYSRTLIRFDDTTYHKEAATGPVPEGNQFFSLSAKTGEGDSEAKRTFTVSQQGVYGIRLWHSARNKSGTSAYPSRVQIEIDGTNIVDFTMGFDTRVTGSDPTSTVPGKLAVGLTSRFLEYEFPTPTLEPGSHTLTIREVLTTEDETDACVGFFDDVRILPRQEGRYVWIPNSSFDSATKIGVYQESSGSRYSMYAENPGNAGWTFETVDGSIASSSAGITQDGYYWYWAGRTNEWTRFSDYRKAYLLNSSRISNEIVIPETGKYTFSVRYSKTDWGVGTGDHSCSVTLRDTTSGTTVDLGKFWPKTAETATYSKAFTAEAGTYVLTFQNTDLPAETGDGEDGRGTIVDEVSIRHGDDVGFTPVELQRRFEAGSVVRDGQVSVSVNLETAGVYRVVADLAGQPLDLSVNAGPTHGFNFYPQAFDVTFDGEAIGRVTVDEPETVRFVLRTPFAAKGTHELSFVSDAEASAPFARSMLNRVALDFLADETLPALDLSGVKMTLDGGARLSLDFDGELVVRGVKKDGVVLQGDLSAETAPDLVTGHGKLKIEPPGLLILFR